MSTTTDTTQRVESGRTYSRGTRRVGYALSIVFNAVLLVVINWWPGWEEFGFLTAEAGQVVPLVNASLIVGLAINIVYLIADPEWLRGLGDAVSAAFAFAILIQLLLVFPFSLPEEGAFSVSADGLELGLTIGLAFAALGSGIAVVVGVVRFAKGVVAPPRD